MKQAVSRTRWLRNPSKDTVQVNRACRRVPEYRGKFVCTAAYRNSDAHVAGKADEEAPAVNVLSKATRKRVAKNAVKVSVIEKGKEP